MWFYGVMQWLMDGVASALCMCVCACVREKERKKEVLKMAFKLLVIIGALQRV